MYNVHTSLNHQIWLVGVPIASHMCALNAGHNLGVASWSSAFVCVCVWGGGW